MSIDWLIVATIAGPIVGVVIGIFLGRALERRPKLIAYFTHASAFPLLQAGVAVHTHGIIIKNVGKGPAEDVRVRHHVRPSQFVVFPGVTHTDPNLQGDGFEIVFPRLVPDEQVAISYLYFPPLVYSQIHAGISHSGGFATEVTALPRPQRSAWLVGALRVLEALGVIAVLYLGAMLIRMFLHLGHDATAV